jgi:hypothetical protein
LPFFGGALRTGDPPVTDSLQGAPTGEVINYSITGDGKIWIVSFSYAPGDPISDTATGVLIYDDQFNVVQLQNPVGDPPHSIWFPLETTRGTAYQVQVFNYTPLKIKYTIGVKKAP